VASTTICLPRDRRICDVATDLPVAIVACTFVHVATTVTAILVRQPVIVVATYTRYHTTNGTPRRGSVQHGLRLLRCAFSFVRDLHRGSRCTQLRSCTRFYRLRALRVSYVAAVHVTACPFLRFVTLPHVAAFVRCLPRTYRVTYTLHAAIPAGGYV